MNIIFTKHLTTVKSSRQIFISINIYPDYRSVVIMTQLQVSKCQPHSSLQRMLEHHVHSIWSLQCRSVFMNLLSGAEYLFRGCLPWAASTSSLPRATGQQSLPSKWRVNKGMFDFQLWVLNPQMRQKRRKQNKKKRHLSVLRKNEYNKWYSDNREQPIKITLMLHEKWTVWCRWLGVSSWKALCCKLQFQNHRAAVSEQLLHQ